MKMFDKENANRTNESRKHMKDQGNRHIPTHDVVTGLTLSPFWSQSSSQLSTLSHDWKGYSQQDDVVVSKQAKEMLQHMFWDVVGGTSKTMERIHGAA